MMQTLRVGLSFWGLCARFNQHKYFSLDTPDGHRYGRHLLVDELLSKNHNVFFMQETRERNPLDSINYSFVDPQTNVSRSVIETCDKSNPDNQNRFPELDVLFLEWRWPTWKNDKTHKDHRADAYEPDLDRQRELIKYYRNRCPIIAWDTDHKITFEDELADVCLIIADPAIKPKTLLRKRVFLPFWTDFKEHFDAVDPYPVYGYVGNRYERDSEFQKFYFDVAKVIRNSLGIQTSMYGNWLQRSPERQSPSAAISMYRDVAFNHRMGFYDSLNIMNKFICTTHVSKNEYYESGFVSPRYFESMAVNCPTLVPSKHIFASNLSKKFIVNDAHDVIDIVKVLRTLNASQRSEIVAEQRELIKSTKMFDVKSTVDFIEKTAK